MSGNAAAAPERLAAMAKQGFPSLRFSAACGGGCHTQRLRVGRCLDLAANAPGVGCSFGH